jgi:hypothetical protein
MLVVSLRNAMWQRGKWQAALADKTRLPLRTRQAHKNNHFKTLLGFKNKNNTPASTSARKSVSPVRVYCSELLEHNSRHGALVGGRKSESKGCSLLPLNPTFCSSRIFVIIFMELKLMCLGKLIASIFFSRQVAFHLSAHHGRLEIRGQMQQAGSMTMEQLEHPERSYSAN